ncbi:nucleoside deaminase [Carboxylicivirga linearis]|uniref:tRNA-specific adenosine deaminase n=1 Tax=Carboxylicivirga linearis TaxID=1628157 RepID=A0ABS5JZH5_9BACT|nr:nucleoside deaminase [Carboxylicivirga linearis]MBS2100298.1 nucleoside deaminase [Carboxylicivirga linearis]
MDQINFSDQYFMKQAFIEAEKAFQKEEVPVGAIVVCEGQIISRAHNLTETLNDVTAHAEMLAITSASEFLGGKYLNQCTLYVTLEPCTMCAGALNWAQLKRLVFGANDEKRGYERCSPVLTHPKTEITKGIMEEECKEIIQRFFRKKR